MRKLSLLVFVVLFNCGSTPFVPEKTLNSVIPTYITWRGNWADTDQRHIQTVIGSLHSIGYLDALDSNLDFSFVGSDADARLHITIRMPDTVIDKDPAHVAVHTGDDVTGDMMLTINLPDLLDLESHTYLVVYGILNTASDPWLYTPNLEVATHCTWTGGKYVVINKATVRLPTYLVKGVCQ